MKLITVKMKLILGKIVAYKIFCSYDYSLKLPPKQGDQILKT
jgi:hypothetical protein